MAKYLHVFVQISVVFVLMIIHCLCQSDTLVLQIRKGDVLLSYSSGPSETSTSTLGTHVRNLSMQSCAFQNVFKKLWILQLTTGTPFASTNYYKDPLHSVNRCSIYSLWHTTNMYSFTTALLKPTKQNAQNVCCFNSPHMPKLGGNKELIEFTLMSCAANLRH